MSRKMCAAALVLALAGAGAAAHKAQERAPAADSIRQEDLKADLYYLASGDMQGRLTGTATNSRAAEFIKSRFERMGLKALNGSYYQEYMLMGATLGDNNMLEIVEAEQPPRRKKAGEDYYPLSFSASGAARGSLVYAGYGISAPEHGHDDYRGDNVRGRIVLALDHEPGERDSGSPFDGLVASEHGSLLRKTLDAQERGAVGILFVQDVHNHPEASFDAAARAYWPEKPPRIPNVTLAGWVEKVRIPAAQVSPGLAATLVRGTGRTLEDLAKSAENAGGFAPLSLPGPEIVLTANLNRHSFAERNVVAFLEGADPELSREVVIVCAHFDHEGADGGQVYYGADDDGSGTVGVLEIAGAYAAAARLGKRPRRSLLFAAWNAEERGMLGAWAYTEKPLRPLENTVAVLNMDMIGRNEEVPASGGGRFPGMDPQTADSNRNSLNVLGFSRSAEMTAEAQRANQDLGMDLRLRYDNHVSGLLARSDHWPFLQRGVPALFFHTGLHPDYHTPADRPEKINYRKLEKVVRLVHQMSWNLAQQDERPRLNPQ